MITWREPRRGASTSPPRAIRNHEDAVDAGSVPMPAFKILFETLVSRPLLEGNTVIGVVIENKGGRSFIGAKVVVDCSADGDVAAAAGAPFIMGSGEDGESLKMQPVGMYFTMTDVDLPALAKWARTSDDIPAQAIPATEDKLDYGLWLTGFNKTVQAYRLKPASICRAKISR